MARGIGVFTPDKRWPAVQFQVVASNPNLFVNASNVTSLKTVVPTGAGASAFLQNYAVPADVGGGSFIWSTANHATDVTNDPGNGIFIPANQDTTGATGAWVRQYSGPVNAAWWGVICDGVTDNSTALNRWAFWARARSAAGFGVELTFPPGTCNFDNSVVGGNLFSNILTLHVIAYGTTFQNTYNQSIHGANFGFEIGWFGACQPLRDNNAVLKNWFIQNTNPGDTQVTTVTAGDASATNFTVNDWVLVGSLDIQYFGYPPNMDQFDYCRVVSFNPSTGVIVLDRPLRWNHRADFPDGPNGIIKCGKARIWQLNTGTWIQGGTTIGRVLFDIDHTYEGMTVNQAPTSSITYTSFTGKRVRVINWTGIGHSESNAIDVIYQNCTFLLQSEPDKLVENVTYDNCTESLSLPFQSSSINSVVIKNMRCLGSMNLGQAKRIIWDGGTSDGISFAQGSNFGQNRSTIVRNVHTRASAQMTGIPGGSPITISGDVSYANGVFKIAQTFAGQQGVFNVRPGSQITMAQTGSSYGGETTTGWVLSITEDVNFIYITTTFPYATLPAFMGSPASAFVVRGGTLRVEGCWGSDGIMLCSDATRFGRNPWDFFRYVWLGQSAASGSFFPGIFGIPERMEVNVIQACATANCTIKFAVFGMGSLGADPTVSLGEWDVIINVSSKGRRIITQDLWDGKLTGDSMTLNSVAINTLPQGRSGDIFWNVTGYTPSLITPQQCPIIEVIWQMDMSPYRKPLPTISDAGGGGPNTLINITGTFQ